MSQQPKNLVEWEPIRAPDLVLGIGTSAGGSEALRSLFASLPGETGIAYVVIALRDASAESSLIELLAGITGLPVEEARDGMEVAADHVYVAPTDSLVQMVEGKFQVEPAGNLDHPRGVIDTFFYSLAEDRQTGAIGILLSGNGTDGTLGLKAISDFGGMTVVQDPETAAFNAKPRSGATLGVADRVLAPDRILPEILNYSHHLQTLLAGDEGGSIREQIGGALGTICEILAEKTEHDFKHYKTSTLVRRIGRRMQLLRLTSAADYITRLTEDENEAKLLFRELLIGVTCFFRDSDSFEALRREVITKILANRGTRDPVRIWVPGCATGEEAYTIAILVREEMDKLGEPVEVQIFATDINQQSLAKARVGAYPLSIAEDLTPERLERFFVRQGARYVVAKEIRELCLFSVHDLIRDSALSRLDLISCRNLLIYLGPHLQKKLIPLFHYALRPGGFLFLGPSESTVTHRELFKPIDVKHRIAQRLATTVRSPAASSRLDASRGAYRVSTATAAEPQDLHLVMQRIVLDEFSPKAVVINDEGRILCASRGADKFLTISEGHFQNNIIKMARSGLRVGLRAAINEAIETRRTVKISNQRIKADKGESEVRITVQPMPQLGESKGLHLVVFEDLGPVATTEDGQAASYDEEAHALIDHLEHELQVTRSDLEQTIQEIESVNEELKSSNEELLSINEEMQSANEALETSREEIQSSNDALARTNETLENLLISTQIATVFLDENLIIDRFTPAVSRIYNLILGDVGRPLSDITHRAVRMPEIDFDKVAPGAPLEDEILTLDGHWYIRRVLPYASNHGRGRGYVISFIDVTDLKRAEAGLKDRESRLVLAIEAGEMGTWEWDPQTNLATWNARMFELLKLAPVASPFTVDLLLDRIHPEDREAVRLEIEKALNVPDHGFSLEFRVKLDDGSIRWLVGKGITVRDDLGRPIRMTGVNFDITERKTREESLREREAHFRTVTESLPQLAWTADPLGRIRWFNQRWLEYSGLSPQEIQGEGWFAAVSQDEQASVRDRWRQAIERGEPFEMTFPLRSASGSQRSFLTRVVPVTDDQGRIIQWFGTNTDIEDQKRAEAELRDANRHKDEFLAMLAHELRNPLSPIRNAVHLLKLTGVDNPTLAGARDMIDRQVTHLVRLVDDLMDVSRITQGKIDLKLKPVELKAVFEAAVESALPLITSRKHHLEVDWPGQPVMIEADVTRLSQALLNLLNNSAKYTEEGGRIWLSSKVLEDAVMIEVRDNGMGIAKELQSKIFDLFTQADRTIDRAQGGLGIGLTIVRRIVEMHRGTIEAFSDGLGLGSTFQIRIPLLTSLDHDDASDSSGVMELRIPGLRIMVIDDHRDSAESLALFLGLFGCEVATSYESKSALDRAAQFKPRVVFCDIGLPGLDGYEVGRRLRQLPATRDSILIALTGYSQDEDRQKSQEAGFLHHLVKPVQPQEVEKLLAKLFPKSP